MVVKDELTQINQVQLMLIIYGVYACAGCVTRKIWPKHKNFAISNVSDSHKPVFILIGGEIPPPQMFQISLKMLKCKIYPVNFVSSLPPLLPYGIKILYEI